jgi:predicted nucleic acid-binding protein
MVLVDTSVWIALYRKRASEVGECLWQLAASNQAAVCGQVWVEFIGGFRRERERAEYEGTLAAFPFLPTSRAAFETAARYLARHPKLGPGDAIIAATAIENRAQLFTLDTDFRVLAKDGLEIL